MKEDDDHDWDYDYDLPRARSTQVNSLAAEPPEGATE